MTLNFLRRPPTILIGLGEGTGNVLKEAGIATIAEMLRRNPRTIHQLVARIPLKKVNGWFAAARILQVEGVEPETADALVRGGITSVEKLAEAGLQTLERALRHGRGRRRLRKKTSLYKLAAMQRDAATLKQTGVISGRVVEAASGAPLAEVAVRAAGRRAKTDTNGAFDLTGVPAGKARLTVQPADRPVVSLGILVRPGEFRRPITFKLKPPSRPVSPARVFREIDGRLVRLGKGIFGQVVVRQLSELPNKTYLKVRRVRPPGTVRLLHLYRTVVGRRVVADLVDVETARLPEGTRIGDVLAYEDGILARAGVTPRDVAAKRFEAVFGPQQFRLKRRLLRPGPRERKGAPHV